MNKEEAMMVIQSLPDLVWKMMSYSEEEAVGIAFKALEELNLYEQNGLCLIPSDVYTRQCAELDRLKAEERLRNSDCVSDTLLIGVDFSPNDEGALVVMRRVEDDIYVLNQLRNEEARELYDKLIGVKNEM